MKSEIIPIIKAYKKEIIYVGILSVLIELINIAYTAIFKEFFDVVLVDLMTNKIVIFAVAILLGTMSISVMTVIKSLVNVVATNKMIYENKNRFLEHIIDISYNDFEKIKIGELKVRLDANDTYRNIALDFIVGTVTHFITITVIFIYLLYLNPLMGLTCFVGISINTYAQNLINKKTYHYANKVVLQNEKIEHYTLLILKNVINIKLNKAKNNIMNKLKKMQNTLVAYEKKNTKETSIIYQVSGQLFEFVKVTMYIVGGILVAKHELTVGGVFAFVSYMGWLDNSFSVLFNNFTQYKTAKAKIDLINEVKNIDIPIDDIKMPSIVNSISVNNVSYDYLYSSFSIKNISFSAKKGDLIAIIGTSGCGKSTLMKILSGLYSVKQGDIYFNDLKVTSSSAENRGNVIAYISQDISLFEGTVREILDLGNIGYSDDLMYKALSVVNLDKFIKGLQNGLDTYISNDQINFSGGQKQRIAIAQAILKDVQVLVLDEITSNLDEATQRLVINNIKKWGKDKIILMTMHRLNVITEFSNIIVMKDGIIESIGKHDELLVKSKTYLKLYKSEEDSVAQKDISVI